ncbi:MAG: CcmD family protein [Saprospiraceae bacterium]
MKKITLLGSFLAISQFLSAQSGGVMESNGKIYVVLATILVIFAGLIIFLVSIDRKLTKLERQIKE